MFDGIKISYRIDDFEAWKAKTKIEPKGKVNMETGVIMTKQFKEHETRTYTARFETYQLTIKEVIRPGDETEYFLTIDGSLHKNYFDGQNYSSFTAAAAEKEINHLCKSLDLDANKARIINLEFGVNIEMNRKPIKFINENLLMHKTTPFEAYEKKNGICIGRRATHTQYSFKVYDKGLQYRLPNKLMRVELRYINMERLRRNGIFNLADLLDKSKTSYLGEFLLEAWDGVLVGEKPKPGDGFGEMGTYRDYWNKLPRKTSPEFKNRRKRYRASLGTASQDSIRELISNEWERLSSNKSVTQIED